MSDFDGLRGCEICGNDTTGRLCRSCAEQEVIDNGADVPEVGYYEDGEWMPYPPPTVEDNAPEWAQKYDADPLAFAPVPTVTHDVFVIESRIGQDFDGSQSVSVWTSLEGAQAACDRAAAVGHMTLLWSAGLSRGGAFAHDKDGLPGDLPVFIIKRFVVQSMTESTDTNESAAGGESDTREP